MHVQCLLRPVMPRWIPLALLTTRAALQCPEVSPPRHAEACLGAAFPWLFAFACGPEVVHSCLRVVSSSVPLLSLFVGCYDAVATFQRGRIPRVTASVKSLCSGAD
mmetsp:Transcript_25296/g.79423  ORF Transcript_25296/g.79423 Transcript_25296/m.79423 type:complete len:106 (-) Transcript_25296:55-372(-)